MKFSFLINQAAVVEYGLEKSTDLTDWAFIDYLLHWQTNPKAKRQNGFVWLDYKHIIKETPLLGLKAKQSISNRVKKLVDLGLVEVEKDNFKRAYFQITSLTHQIVSFRACPISGTPVPNEDLAVLPQEHPVPGEGHITNQHLTNHQEPTKSAKPQTPKSTQTWNAYCKAYLQRYGVAPIRSAKVNKLLCQFVDQVGSMDAPLIAAYYLSLDDRWYQTKSHDVGTLLQNAQSVRTQWATGVNHTSCQHKQNEQTSHNQQVVKKVTQMIEEGRI